MRAAMLWLRRPEATVLMLLLTLIVAAPAAAQIQPEVRSNPVGFHLKGVLNGSALSAEDSDDWEAGGGAGVAIGVGFNRTFTLYLELVGAQIEPEFGDSYTLGQADLGGRLHFGSERSAWMPYLDVALSGLAATFDIAGTELDLTGAGVTGGGGILYFFTPSLGLDVGLKLTFGEFSEAKAGGYTEDIELGVSTSRFNVGVSWWRG